MYHVPLCLHSPSYVPLGVTEGRSTVHWGAGYIPPATDASPLLFPALPILRVEALTIASDGGAAVRFLSSSTASIGGVYVGAFLEARVVVC